MNNHDILTQFLQSNKLMQLATQAGDKLWICNVYYAVDKEGSIYWTSARSRRHSQEIENNPNVAVTIVHDPEKKQAVQMSGSAQRIPVAESDLAHRLYGEKFGMKQSRMDEVQEDTPQSRAYWKFTPDFIELWDEVNNPDSPKQRVLG